MPSRAWARAAIAGMRLLPVNAISRAAGRFAALRLPAPVQRAEIRLFSRVFDVDLDEARDPIESYACFQDFFTRPLREGARPIDPGPEAFVSPCDGAWGSSGFVKDGAILQVKGRPYSVAALLGSQADAHRYEGGRFATLYLSPRDYHRFHTPAAVRVVRASHLPGRLWPVNSLGLEGVDGLFAENERICAHMELDGSADAPGGSGGALCLVAVGATMVGSVRVTFDDLETNRAGAGPAHADYQGSPPRFEKGEEWGRFRFGSTIVLLAAPGVVELECQPPGTKLRLGERIGTLLGR